MNHLNCLLINTLAQLLGKKPTPQSVCQSTFLTSRPSQWTAGETTQSTSPNLHRALRAAPKSVYLFLEQAFVISWTKRIRTGYVLCRALFKMKMCGSLFHYYKEFQHGNSRTLNQAWRHSERGAPCDCTGPMPVKLALKRMWLK